MRIFALFITFLLAVTLLTAAWWMTIVGQGGQEGIEAFPLPIHLGVIIAFIVQVFGWNVFCKFPRSLRLHLGVGFPLSATLMALGLGNYLDGFLPRERDAIWNVAMVMGNIGVPAFVIGVLLFLICCISWRILQIDNYGLL